MIENICDEKYKKLNGKLFDFYYDKTLIKCIGIDSFISKIDIEEMKSYAFKNNYTQIKLFTLNEIDSKLINNDKIIKTVKKDEIKVIFEKFILNNIDELELEIKNIDETILQN